MLYVLEFGWGGRIRTSESRFQRPVSYRLTTPQSKTNKFQILKFNPAKAGPNLKLKSQNFLAFEFWLLKLSYLLL
jgi:hypothetical protein